MTELKQALRFILLCYCSTVNALRPIEPGALFDNRPSLTCQATTCSSFQFDSQPLLFSIRGGAKSSSENGIVTRIRGVLDKFVTYLEGRSPTLSGYVRKFILSLESITGLELVSKTTKVSSGSKKKKRKKKKSSAIEKENLPEPRRSEEVSSKSKSVSSSSKRKTKAKSTTAASTKKAATTKTKAATATATTTTPSSSSLASTKTKQSSLLAAAHLQKDLKANSPNYRIQRELKAFLTDPPPNLKVTVGKNLRVWIVTMKGAKNTIYEGETFKLRIAFPAQYPTVPPSVYFLPPNIPVHEHVYTNGDICLSLLGQDWRPTMTAQSIAVSILSILSSAQSKSLPMDNARHALNKPGEYQKDWVYHDDNC
ncbi:hypothetical protein ACA910_000938 [Epithemia clementina (nom. ined.)]